MLTDLEYKLMQHFFISFPHHVNMGAIIKDATSESPQLLYTVNPIYIGMPLPFIMAGVCALIKTFS